MNSQRTVLVVEDELELNETYCEWFEYNDFKIVGRAKNGLEAIRIIQDKNPQYVILDTMMQDYDGNYVIKQLEKLHKDCKIIVITGCAECHYEGKEIIGVLRKPCKLEEIKNVIDGFEENFIKLV